MTEVRAIFAVDASGGIGNKGKLPWPHSKEDMAWFRDNTKGHVIVMGRKTWESIGSKKLPNRVNVVLSSNRDNVEGNPDHIFNCETLAAADILQEKYPHLFIWFIGGAKIIEDAIPICKKVFVTHFPDTWECDTFLTIPEGYDRFKVSTYMTNHNFDCSVFELNETHLFSIWSAK